MHPLFTYLDKTWPLAASILAGCFAFGTLHQDVESLKAQQTHAVTDHDSIVRLEQGQTDMKSDLTDIKSTLHRIEQSR